MVELFELLGARVTFRELQIEIGKRLYELRMSVGHGLSPEDIAIEAKDRGLKFGARTIREWEKGMGKPSLDKLCIILEFYQVSLHEFFSFTAVSVEAQLVGDFLHVIKKNSHREALEHLIGTFRK